MWLENHVSINILTFPKKKVEIVLEEWRLANMFENLITQWMSRSQILKLKGHCLPTYWGCTWIFKMCLWTKGTSGVKFIYTVTGVTIVQRTLLTKSKDNILKALQYLIFIKWYDIALNIAFYLLWVKKKVNQYYCLKSLILSLL